MRMAITDRASADTRPLVLRIENTGFDRQPPIGTKVKAIGNAGWRYLGVVTEHDADGMHYTICVESATRPPVLMSPADLARKLQVESARTSQR